MKHKAAETDGPETFLRRKLAEAILTELAAGRTRTGFSPVDEHGASLGVFTWASCRASVMKALEEFTDGEELAQLRSLRAKLVEQLERPAADIAQVIELNLLAAYSRLSPIVTEAAAYLECGNVEKAVASLAHARKVIEGATLREVIYSASLNSDFPGPDFPAAKA